MPWQNNRKRLRPLLLEDFQDCKDWQKSGLFKTVYRDQYNAFGGNPYPA